MPLTRGHIIDQSAACAGQGTSREGARVDVADGMGQRVSIERASTGLGLHVARQIAEPTQHV